MSAAVAVQAVETGTCEFGHLLRYWGRERGGVIVCTYCERARRYGEVPPRAAPVERRRTVERRHTHATVSKVRAVDVIEDAEWIARTGDGWSSAVVRLGYGGAGPALEQLLYRHGRPDLVARLKANGA